jgi:hypothetical protein
LLGLALLAGAVFAVICYEHDPLHRADSPAIATAQRIYMARHTIADYYGAHGRLPQDVLNLLRDSPKGYATDASLRPFRINVHPDNVTVEISSLGNDGHPGGGGADRDVIGIFRADVPAGEQIEQVGPWIKNPLDDVKPWKF